jgi:GNAT superfamily N-acetyltransferase
MDNILIRPALESDVPEIAALQTQWCDEDITWGLMPDTQEELLVYVHGYCFVARLGNRMVGYVTARVLAGAALAVLPSGAPCLEFKDLYVVSSLRSRGVGGRLLECVLDRAKAAGISNFKLWSSTKDISRTISFYQRHGFTIAGVMMVRMVA